MAILCDMMMMMMTMMMMMMMKCETGSCWQENVVRDFELNELHLQCKKTPLTKHRDRNIAAASTGTAATAAAEASDDLAESVDSDVKKTQ